MKSQPFGLTLTVNKGGTEMKKKDIYRTSLIIIISIFMIFCTTNSFAQPAGQGGPPAFISPYPAGSIENEILQVVANFDKAFNSNSYELMSSVWWHSSKISRFSPGKPGALLTEDWKLFDPRFKARAQRKWPVTRIGRHNSKVTLLDDDTAIATSYVTLRIAPPNQDPQIDYLRTTLVIQKINDKWLIAHMHASRLP